MKAQEVLFVFLTSWVGKDFKKAFEQVSKTWAETNKVEDLKKILPAGIEGFEIGGVKSKTPTQMIIGVDLVAGGESKTGTIELVCEAWPGKPDPHGDWGVLPESIWINSTVDTKAVEPEEKPKAATKPAPKKNTHASTKKG